MTTESQLKSLFDDASAAVAGRAPDAAAVIRRSRMRRLPGQVAVGGAGALAIAGIGVAGATGIQSMRFGASTSAQLDSSAGSSEHASPETPGDGERAPAEKITLCGGPLANIPPSSTGLVLTTRFPATVPADGRQVTGTVTLTNTGTEPITGTTAASPTITLSKDGLVLWHSNGPMIMLAVVVDLAPGASMDYPATFTPVRCESVDERGEGFREDLPALPAGRYQLSAAIDLTRQAPDGGFASLELVTGPLQEVALG
jgi:hypothetical protein